MKSIKYIACVAIGLVAFGVVSVRAAATGPISIGITTYSQDYSEADNVGTFTSTTTTLNTAKILAKVVDALGITVPAGSKLAVSTAYDNVNNVNPGDVVIVSPTGKVLYDLDNGIETQTGYAQIYFWFWQSDAWESKWSAKSETFTDKGYGGIYIDIVKYDTSDVAGWGLYCDTDDDTGTIQATRGRYGNQLTTGNMTFAGGGELVVWTGNNSDWWQRDTNYQPANFSVGVQAVSVPWEWFPGNFED